MQIIYGRLKGGRDTGDSLLEYTNFKLDPCNFVSFKPLLKSTKSILILNMQVIDHAFDLLYLSFFLNEYR